MGGIPPEAADDARRPGRRPRARGGRRVTDVVALRGIAAGLIEGGITDVIVCPGSRSTPLALAVKARPELTVRVLLDERSAGFFALGLARASRRPVAVVVTSGTAAANLMPSVMEAASSTGPAGVFSCD